MKVLIDIGHPAHVHFFRNTIWELEKKGHQVLVTTIDKEVSIDLLKAYNIKYIAVGKTGFTKFGLISQWIKRDYEILKIAKEFNPDVLMGISNPCIAHSSRFLRKKSIIFDDTEHASFTHKITYPFADAICTPSCFKLDVGKRQIRYNGYHELAYLDPNRFEPDSTVLNELGLSENEEFIILRFISRSAFHDVGHSGLTLEDKLNAVKEFEKYGHVFITSEKKSSKIFEKYRITISPEKMHHLLYYATLLYGESATMASECAVLGTHAIFCDYAGRGYTDEEEIKYDLVYNFYDEKTMGKESLNKALELLENKDLRKEGMKKREKLLKDKIDVTKFIVDFIEQSQKN